MPPSLRFPLLFLFATTSLLAQVTVGGNAPNPTVANDFTLNYFRNAFYTLVVGLPIANVAKYGSTGYIQEFNDLAKDAKLALILPNLTLQGTQNAVLQMINPLYGYYSTVGVATAGYPAIDTQLCPAIASCQYQLFTLNYALFYYATGNPNGNGFSVSGNIFNKWTALGGAGSALGMGYNAQTSVTAASKVTAATQQFTTGLVASITSGVNIGTSFAVVEPAYDQYVAFGGVTGLLGLPTSDDVTLASGLHRQTFEGGRIEYQPGGSATVLLKIVQVDLTPTGTASLSYKQTLNASVRTFDNQAQEAFGRAVSWTTSNSNVVSVVASGYTAILTAVGSGIATITATSEGKVSSALAISANSPCCQVGQGAPTAAVQQAFQNAVTRSRINVLVPAAAGVTRIATGYAQDLYSPDGTLHYLVAESDSSGIAFVLTGPTLTAFSQLGGLTGSLGYPLSDLSAGGTQIFQKAALSGSPVQAVTGPVLLKWAALKYEAGVAGVPTSAQAAFSSQSGFNGFAQSFAGGVIYGISNGSRAGQGYLVTGPILARYLALSGPAGALGVPIVDSFSTNSIVRQNFENGYMDLQPGAATAVEHIQPRTPAISTNPASTLAGSRLHVAISGFTAGASLRVSQTGQAEFLVTTATGSYDWDLYIVPGTAAGTVTIKATDTNTGAAAAGTYSIRSIADAKPAVTKSQGDNQTGSPGALLAVPLTVTVTDGTGAPISGTAVSFSASPGASVSPTSAVTDASGRATTAMRLPPTAGISAVTVRSLGQLAIFNAQATGTSTLANFPLFAAAAPAGTQVASAAAMLRFYQNRSLMPSAHGLADPTTLDTYLQTLTDGYLNASQLVNLWRLTQFTGGNVTVSLESKDIGAIRALVAGGDPVLLSLALTQDQAASGGTVVVATGVAADGSVLLLDSNPAFARTSLTDYLSGFIANGHAYQGTVLSALRLIPKAPGLGGFLLESLSQPIATLPALGAIAAAGTCAGPLVLEDPAAPVASQFIYCDGSQVSYQLTVGMATQVALIDLAPSGTTLDLTSSAPAGYQVARVSGQLAVSAPTVAFTPDAILNAASFVPGIAPGGLISIFGSGLSGAAQQTVVTIGGQVAPLLLASPFQINAQVPANLAVGASTIQVTSAYGTQSQPVTVQATAPGIFVVVNQDGTVNGPTAPALRGSTIVIYSTGLGATSVSGKLSVTNAVVTVVLGGTELTNIAFSGLTPIFPGLYQVNFQIPVPTAPGLLALQLKSGIPVSNSVLVTVQ